MAETLSAAEAAARMEAADTLGIPLATGQPPAFMAALGERSDWEDLRVYARHATAFVPDGATLQTGIGTIPSGIASELADSGGATTACTPRCSRTV